MNWLLMTMKWIRALCRTLKNIRYVRRQHDRDKTISLNDSTDGYYRESSRIIGDLDHSFLRPENRRAIAPAERSTVRICARLSKTTRARSDYIAAIATIYRVSIRKLTIR